MTERKEKFTPGPWRHLKQYDHIGDFYRSYVCYGEPDAVNPDDSTFPPDQCICGCGRSHWQQNEANAVLIAASPSLYASESLNLELIKKILVGYKDMAKLILTDKDVQEAVKDEAVLKEHLEFNPENVSAVLKVLRTRISETEAILAIARGEVQG